MDYRALLKKYIGHVEQEEGTTFLQDHRYTRTRFTPSEWAELQVLRTEAEGTHP